MPQPPSPHQGRRHVGTAAARAVNSRRSTGNRSPSLTCVPCSNSSTPCPGGLRAPAGGTLDIAVTDPGTGALRATVTRGELERLVRRGCPDHPQERCRCPVLDRPPPVDRYMPTPAQRRFVTTRDRICRHPGCRNDAAWADLDHVVPHGKGGPTDCENLCCLCRRHHRLKTHAPGWRFAMTPDGLLSVTTPSGVTRTSRPPGLAHRSDAPSLPDDDPPPF